MQKFLAGFATASLLWGGAAAALYLAGVLLVAVEDEVMEPVVAIDLAPDAGAGTVRARKLRRRGVRRAAGDAFERSPTGGRVPTGEAMTGDDLGEGATRRLDVGASGGEGQLTEPQIERALDGAMPRIRRCLILVPGDELVTGRLMLGIKIAGSGRVTAVNLSGPAAVTTGDPGDCLRAAIRAVAFPTFDGPEMITRYPLTLE